MRCDWKLWNSIFVTFCNQCVQSLSLFMCTSLLLPLGVNRWHILQTSSFEVYRHLHDQCEGLRGKKRITPETETRGGHKDRFESCVQMRNNYVWQTGKSQGKEQQLFVKTPPSQPTDTPTHHISTPASSANKHKWNNILKPTPSCTEHETLSKLYKLSPLEVSMRKLKKNKTIKPQQ